MQVLRFLKDMKTITVAGGKGLASVGRATGRFAKAHWGLLAIPVVAVILIAAAGPAIGKVASRLSGEGVK